MYIPTLTDIYSHTDNILSVNMHAHIYKHSEKICVYSQTYLYILHKKKIFKLMRGYIAEKSSEMYK